MQRKRSMPISRGRRARAGSAYIEALAVMTLFTLLFTLAYSYGRDYTTQLLAGEARRATTWADPEQGACSDWDVVRDALEPSGPQDIASRIHAALALRRVLNGSAADAQTIAVQLTRPRCVGAERGEADVMRAQTRHWLDEILHEAGR